MKRRHSDRINRCTKVRKADSPTPAGTGLQRPPPGRANSKSTDNDDVSEVRSQKKSCEAIIPHATNPTPVQRSPLLRELGNPKSPKSTRSIFLHSRVFFVGDINLRNQTFGCTLDLHVQWDSEDEPHPAFDPIIRFPEAVTVHETLRINISKDRLKGYRATIEGHFRSKMDLRMFPFDAQPLMVEMQLGRCKAAGVPLTHTGGWRLEHHPEEPNVLANQIDNEHIFRPCRFSRSVTGPLESSEVMCKYELWIPVERDWKHYVINHYFFTCMVCFLNCVVPFWLPLADLSNRIMAVLTLYLLLVTYKYAASGSLPVLPYNTALDRYILWNFFIGFTSLIGLFYVNEDKDRNVKVQILLGCLALLMHVHVVAEILLARKTRLLCISSAGSIDRVMQRILRANGIELNELGLIENRPMYTALQQSVLISDSD